MLFLPDPFFHLFVFSLFSFFFSVTCKPQTTPPFQITSNLITSHLAHPAANTVHPYALSSSHKLPNRNISPVPRQSLLHVRARLHPAPHACRPLHTVSHKLSRPAVKASISPKELHLRIYSVLLICQCSSDFSCLFLPHFSCSPLLPIFVHLLIPSIV